MNAYAPVPTLVTSLGRAGWGELRGREFQGVRTTLHALVASLPHKSGQGWTTAEQIADTAGLSSRWVRRCLLVLEDLGVIEWTRGGVIDGRPAPSFVRVVKRVLLDLIRAARPLKDEAERARRAATHARIAELRGRYVMGKRNRRSGHAEVNASLLTPTGGGASASPLNPTERTDMQAYTVPVCDHGGDGRTLPDGQPRCPMCRARLKRAKIAAAARPGLDVRALAGGDDTLTLDVDA